jgi:hypothetical protein
MKVYTSKQSNATLALRGVAGQRHMLQQPVSAASGARTETKKVCTETWDCCTAGPAHQRLIAGCRGCCPLHGRAIDRHDAAGNSAAQLKGETHARHGFTAAFCQFL